MSYTIKKIEDQNLMFNITTEHQGKEISFNVICANSESEIPDLVEHHLNFISNPVTNVTLPIPQSITRRQCAIELRERQLITPLEALNMTKYGDVPGMVSQIFSQMTATEKIVAETDFAADTYLRTNPLLNQIMTQSGATTEEIDDFFRQASTR